MTWIAALSSATIVATLGATAVLAENPACVVDGQPVTHEQYAADNSLCPNGPTPPGDPAPVEPPPADPAPVDPPPVDPAPVDPAPVDPAPTDPAPTEPGPATPIPPTGTAPTDPAPADPGPATPVPPAGTDPATANPTTAQPVTDETGGTRPTPVTPNPTAPQPTKPVTTIRETAPTPPPPAPKPDVRTEDGRTNAMLEAKQFQAAPFRDARLFREQFTPAGRIPEQPELPEDEVKLLTDASAGTGTSWQMLAAVAWLESRWGDPSAGGLVGRRLLDVAWDTHGTDGDGDGVVDRANAADQARTVAVFLSEARASKQAALEAYFSGTHRDVMAQRAIFLADYFEALGQDALIHGLDDPAVRAALEERVLSNEDVEIYDGGRSDIEDGLVDPRVLVTMEFLANRFNSVAISSLISGHGVYTSSGNVSLHSYGQAMDIAALDGESILGHQQRNSRTYQAVQQVLLLPNSMQPAELISLWEMGGASFALSDHHDHIHVGWKTEAGPSFGQEEDVHGH